VKSGQLGPSLTRVKRRRRRKG